MFFSFTILKGFILAIEGQTTSSSSQSSSQSSGQISGSNQNFQLQNQMGATTRASDASHLALGRMMNRATEQVISPGISDPNIKKQLNAGVRPECVNRVQEANAMVLKQMEIKKCVQEKEEKKQKVAQVIEKMQEGDKKCYKTVPSSNVQCDIYKTVDNVLTNPYYKMEVYGNLYVLKAEDKPVMMAVFEHIEYEVDVESVEEEPIIDQPDAEYIFNQPGILIANHGTITLDEQENKCQECFAELDKLVVDGQNACGGCDSDGENMFKSLKKNYTLTSKGSTMEEPAKYKN